MNKHDNNQSGQIIVVLLLIVVVVLAIGLSVVGRSNTEVSTASKIENSARAFSAAEAGIEHAIAVSLSSGVTTKIPFTNNSNSSVLGTSFPNQTVHIIEQQNIGGTDPNNPTYAFAQFWFVDPKNISLYQANTMNNRFDLYFGDPTIADRTQRPAIEIHIIYTNGAGSYSDVKYYIDPEKGFRGTDELSDPTNTSNCIDNSNVLDPAAITTNFGDNRLFHCLAHVVLSPASSSNYPLLARIRVLYSSNGQNVAIGPTGSDLGLLPAQINLYTSNGFSGDSQRTVQVTRDTDVMPYIFDFALYSDNGASK